MRIKFYKLILPILAISLLTGCGKSVTEYVSDLASNASDLVSNMASEVSGTVSDYLEEAANNTPQHYASETFNEVFELIQAKDCQAIFDMFSEYDKEYIDIMPDIEKLVEFIDGKVTEIGHVGASNLYSSVMDGVVVDAAYTATSFVKTDCGVTYWVKVRVVTAADIETKLGLDSVYILDCDVFNEYVNECSAWNERRINGAKEEEPVRPENVEIGVNY